MRSNAYWYERFSRVSTAKESEALHEEFFAERGHPTGPIARLFINGIVFRHSPWWRKGSIGWYLIHIGFIDVPFDGGPWFWRWCFWRSRTARVIREMKGCKSIAEVAALGRRVYWGLP